MQQLIWNVCTLERGGVIALFNPFWPDPVYIDAECFDRFQQSEWSDAELSALNEHRLVTVGGANDIADFRREYQLEKEVMTLYLILTRTCNLRCNYCFEVERHGVRQYDQEMMSLEVAIRSIDIFAQEYARNQSSWNYQVILYGGEPVLNWKVLMATVEYMEQLKSEGRLPQDLRIALNTNGTLVDQKKTEFLALHNVSVAVSIDGDRTIHDRNRLDCKGKGSYDRALAGYNQLADSGATVCPSVTVSPETVGRTLAIVQGLHVELGFNAVGLNPMMGAPDDFESGPEVYHELIASDIIETFKWARELGIAEDRALRKVNSMMSLKPHTADCCAYGQQIVIQPDGSIGICHATSDYNYCTVWDYQSPYETEQVANWTDRLPLFHESCADCEAIFICGGGCAHSALLLHEDLEALDSGFCVHSKSMLNFLIWDIFDKMTS